MKRIVVTAVLSIVLFLGTFSGPASAWVFAPTSGLTGTEYAWRLMEASNGYLYSSASDMSSGIMSSYVGEVFRTNDLGDTWIETSTREA